MQAAPYDHTQTLYRTLLVFATVAVLALVVGLIEFVYFEPPGKVSGATATIVGVYDYDSSTRMTSGADHSAFPRTQQFAAVVDWSSVPPNMKVDARWYDAFGDVVGHVGPTTADQLSNSSVVPIVVPKEFHHSLPGQYLFVVERFEGSVPVEVLARRIVRVERS